MRHVKLVILALSITLVGPALLDAAPAEAGPTLFGIRGGFTDDPDSIFLGGHVAIHPRFAHRLRIEPSMELGFGDDVDFITLRATANFKFMFPVSRDAAFFPLIGASFYYLSLDDDICSGDCDNSDVGLNLGGGFEYAGFGIELALGLPDENLPDFTVTFSYTFW
ncbi:MAG: hypothetical protein Tsb0020_37990 [Haliangiales bacterium]